MQLYSSKTPEVSALGSHLLSEVRAPFFIAEYFPKQVESNKYIF
jgi:hypothetical protein